MRSHTAAVTHLDNSIQSFVLCHRRGKAILHVRDGAAGVPPAMLVARALPEAMASSGAVDAKHARQRKRQCKEGRLHRLPGAHSPVHPLLGCYKYS